MDVVLVIAPILPEARVLPAAVDKMTISRPQRLLL